MKDFFTRFFNMNCSEKYRNEKKKFSSYFLSFESGARIELMHRSDILEQKGNRGGTKHGFTHLAISVGSKEKVNELTELITRNGYKITGEPRTTGEGYFRKRHFRS